MSTPASSGGQRPIPPAMVRDATLADWGDIWPFFKRIIAAGDTYCLPTAMLGGDARNLWFGGPNTTVLAAVDPRLVPTVPNPETPIVGSVVGTVSIRPNHEAAGSHIANASFMVNPDHAGRGVGRALGVAALARARRLGFKGMQFNAVVESNTGAVALWTSLGFRIIGTVPGAFIHPEHGPVGLHVMFREL